jgi:hypothetical protein
MIISRSKKDWIEKLRRGFQLFSARRKKTRSACLEYFEAARRTGLPGMARSAGRYFIAHPELCGRAA